ncbi:MAG: hypothetical protein ABSF67_04375 [Roseiarcus sp.]
MQQFVAHSRSACSSHEFGRSSERPSSDGDIAYNRHGTADGDQPYCPKCPRPSVGSRRFLHDDESGALQVLDEAPCHDRRRDLPGVALPLAAVEAQREREGVGEVFGLRGCQAV